MYSPVYESMADTEPNMGMCDNTKFSIQFPIVGSLHLPIIYSVGVFACDHNTSEMSVSLFGIGETV